MNRKSNLNILAAVCISLLVLAAPAAGNIFSDAWGWDSPQYYMTIQTADIDGDGADELLGRGGGGMETYDCNTAINWWELLAFNNPQWDDAQGWGSPQYYMTIQTADVDGDGDDELLGRGSDGMWTYDFKTASDSWELLAFDPIWPDAWGWASPQYYMTIQTADVDGDGDDELLGRGAGGMETYDFNTASDSWEQVAFDPIWPDAWGWDAPHYYMTIQTADVDGDGDDELLGRGAGGMETYDFNTASDSWEQVALNNPQWDDAQGWGSPQYYRTIQTADVDGDGDDELLGRGAFGIDTYDFNTAGNSWELLAFDPIWPDAWGWASPQYYMTIQTADVDGDGDDELLGRGAGSMETYDFNTASDSWEQLAFDPNFSDAQGWGSPQYYRTIQTADIDGDGRSELVARSMWCIFSPGYGPIRNRTQERSYLTIQLAINYSMDGDQIEVAPGSYKEAINFIGKSVRLYSRAGPEVTTIDGTGYYHVVQCISGEDANTILEGFTITGGNANGPDPNDKYGGGMFNSNSSPTVTNCTFSNNQASERGAGMHNENSAPTLTNCIFRVNTAAIGAGMDNYPAGNPVLTNCTFYGNVARMWGGGMYNYQSSPTITNCTFSSNSDGSGGGGMFNYDDSRPVVTNCIVWGNFPNEIADVPPSISTVTYSTVRGGWSGDGNIDKCPMLRNVAEGDLSLAPWSPCIDAGDNNDVSPDATDITGLPRLIDGDCNGTAVVDMGAYEFRHDYGGDFDSSCLVNFGDFTVLGLAWLTSPLSDNWDPVCDISIPADANVDNKDLKVLAENWLRDVNTPITCDPNRLKDEFGLGGLCAAAVLNASPCAYSPNDIAQALYDVGYSAGDSYLALLLVCGITDAFSIEQILFNAGYSPAEYLEFTAVETVREFVPVLYFDREYKGLPMSAQVYFETVMSPSPDDPNAGKIKWTTPSDGPCYPNCSDCGAIRIDGRDEWNCGLQSYDFSLLRNGEVPTYYKVISDIDSAVDTGPQKGRLRITYWWFYGFQRWCHDYDCTGSTGEHHGDWEHIMVTTDPDRTRADAVTYFFHGDWYTRKWPGGFNMVGNRPVVYVGKVAHGNYHSQEEQGFGDDGITLHPWHCCEYADWRNNNANTIWYNASSNLVSLRGNSEPWMLADRIGSTYEHYGQEYEIVSWRWGPRISYKGLGCEWKHNTACGTHPTIEDVDWALKSCDEKGCNGKWGFCTYSIEPDQGWPWDGESMSSAAEPVTHTTGEALASCRSCDASRFAALVRLGDYWLAGAEP